MTSTVDSKDKNYGDYIILQGVTLKLKPHPTDFSVMASHTTLSKAITPDTEELSLHFTRVHAKDEPSRDELMDQVRQSDIAHHIYQVEGNEDDELVIDDRIILNLRREGTGELEEIIKTYHLNYDQTMGQAHVLSLTDQTGKNPLKVANEIAERDEVGDCVPEIMLETQFHRMPTLFPRQWYLTTDLDEHPDIKSNADIQAPEAWSISRGDPEIVIAVLDDGFDLEHPAFHDGRIHTDRLDFQGEDKSPKPENGDYHGTPVSSIAVGSHNGGAMRGIAPNCTFLPIRIGFGQFARPISILNVFRYISERADVLNCSFGLSPQPRDPFHPDFRSEITQLTRTGGRRGKGLVMVFSAGNDDAPTFLKGRHNVNGVKFVRNRRIAEIPPGNDVFSGYPMTDGVVVAGAMSSLTRKSGYSCWGPHITVTAPSNNQHYIMDFIRPGSDTRREKFVANYRGLGQVAASNRPGEGGTFRPLRDDPSTLGVRENFYTDSFGGTSGAAPIITGVVGLMLSANSELSAQEIKQILASTADRDLDPSLDLENDPNIQGLSGEFVNGRSLYFGSGKVNAFRAVSRAQALASLSETPRKFYGEARPALAIPDSQPQGVVSAIDITGSGKLSSISVSVDITHTYRGDLNVTLISPGGFPVELHRMNGGAANDLKKTYTPDNNDGLQNLIEAGIDVNGSWILHISDNLHKDEGRLNAWSLDLGTF